MDLIAKETKRGSRIVSAAAAAGALLLGAAVSLGVCGPFTDVSDATFCPFVVEIFTLGITTGVTPTTYEPAQTVTRLQMAAFLSRTVDGTLRRRSRRAILGEFWTPTNATVLGLTTVGTTPVLSAYDGLDVWVVSSGDATVTRVRAANGNVVDTWTGASDAGAVIPAMGRILVTGAPDPGAGRLYTLDPAAPAGAVSIVASNLGNRPSGIAADGTYLWTSNFGGSVSRISPQIAIPWSVATVTTGFNKPVGILFDGASVWVTDFAANALLKVGSNGAVLQSVPVDPGPRHPAFDGTNIWVPTGSASVTVVRASSGAVLRTLTGNGLGVSGQAAFDGERVLVTNSTGNSVSLWKAADLTPLGSVSVGPSTGPWGASSDGVNFFLCLENASKLARF